jgi:KDO2-lipid IV(A) lauroyltransferase
MSRVSVHHVPLKKRMRYAIEMVGVYLLYGFFWILPLEVASATGGLIVKHVGMHMGITRVALRNLALAFPEKTEQERREIARGMWDNLGRIVAEYPHLRRIWRNVELVGAEHIEAIKQDKRGTIFFGGHIGNWEIGAMGGHATGVPLAFVYRRPNNPWVESLLRYARKASATGYLPKGSVGAQGMLSVLKKGGALGILMDQKLNNGVSVPFFGHPAMTAPAIARFALSRGCPLHPLRIERLGGAKFRMTIFPALEIQKTGDEVADVQRILVDINNLFEVWIRERPSQWLWLHRRWSA